MANLVLPTIPILSFYLLFRCSGARTVAERLVRSAVLWSFALVALIELTSQFEAVTRRGLTLGWCAVLLTLGLYIIARGIPLWPEAWPRLPEPRQPYFAVLAIVVLPSLAIAILTLPNTWDGLTYHIARVDHWIQDHSVAFYPTAFAPHYAPLGARQNEFAPFAEYVILNFRLLCGSYALANLTQWFAMLGSLVLIFSIARMLGAGLRSASLAVVFGATVPMGVLQASSTQNDYCVAFWLMAFVAQFLRWRETRSALDMLYASAAFGLAVLTKGTALLLGIPFAVWLLTDFVLGFRAPLRRKAALAAMCAVCALVPNLPHAERNIAAYGSPFGGPTPALVRQPAITLSLVAANAIRDVALNFATPDAAANDAIVDRLTHIGRIFGLDLADRASTFLAMPFALRNSFLSEESAGNPLHALVLFGVFAALPWLRSRAGHCDHVYLACVVAQFLLFAALLRWQPWGSRLLLPAFILSAPLLGVVADRFASPGYGTAVTALLLAGALPYAFFNETKPLIAWDDAHPAVWRLSRHATMFVSRPHLDEEYTAVAAYLKQCGCNMVGLATVQDAPMAPVFSALAEQGLEPARIEEIALAKEPARLSYPLGPFSPNAILWLGRANPRSIAFGGATFLPVFETNGLHVYRPAQSQGNNRWARERDH